MVGSRELRTVICILFCTTNFRERYLVVLRHDILGLIPDGPFADQKCQIATQPNNALIVQNNMQITVSLNIHPSNIHMGE